MQVVLPRPGQKRARRRARIAKAGGGACAELLGTDEVFDSDEAAEDGFSGGSALLQAGLRESAGALSGLHGEPGKVSVRAGQTAVGSVGFDNPKDAIWKLPLPNN